MGLGSGVVETPLKDSNPQEHLRKTMNTIMPHHYGKSIDKPYKRKQKNTNYLDELGHEFSEIGCQVVRK